VVIVGLCYITLALPDVGKPENIKVELTSARITRGEYLANHVVLCTDCHSKRDWGKFAGPMVPGSAGGGGELFDGKVGFPGEVHVPNITPYKLSAYTDGELFRAITTGERKDGSAIFPLMPWPYYSKMSREDVYAIIAYIRTLAPIKADYAKSRLNFPLNIIVHTMPAKAALGELPSATDTLKYGAYMCNASGCVECHTKADNGQIIKGMEFAGGREFLVNGITVRSANISPDKETGIGKWKVDDFVQMFKSFGDPLKSPDVAKGGFQTIMPWYDYSGMTETDLRAIFKYLKTVKAIKNKVILFQQPTSR
jgi:hypothetical protein